jgi:hypothetical protein
MRVCNRARGNHRAMRPRVIAGLLLGGALALLLEPTAGTAWTGIITLAVAVAIAAWTRRRTIGS